MEAQLDLGLTEDNYQTSLDYMNVRDFIDPEMTTMRWSRMRLFKATVHNSIFNPFDSVTDEI